MKKKRLAALLLAFLMVFQCAGCGFLDEPEEEPDKPSSSHSSSSDKPHSDITDSLQRMSMSVSRSTGKLTVKRPGLSSSGGSDVPSGWTILVYLCGTDLETEYGAASNDLVEMMDGAAKKGVRFVVETGGTYEWQVTGVENDSIQRFLVEKGDAELVDEQRLSGMGRQETLSDFLIWGAKEYPSEHMGAILWDHGGGSINGICFDERDDYDSLSLRELDGALFDACEAMGRKFDFIGFDACLMGTLETANVLASYADYMYASEEVEPGLGWNYVAIGSYLSKNPDANAKDLGKVTCDGFIEACREYDQDDMCTLSVIDLSKLDDLLIRFNDFALNMYEASAETSICSGMIRGIEQADNFGGNNRSEGYTNMVDMGGLITACADYAEGADKALRALDKAVVYNATGSAHSGVSGLSMYYPLCPQGSEELAIFGEICPSPYYLSFVDRQSQGSVNGGNTENYDNDFWFFNDEWILGLLNEEFNNGGNGNEEDYWNFYDNFEQTGESPLITFQVEPELDEDDGSFWFALDDDGLSYAAGVYGVVYEISDDGEDLIEIGYTYDVIADWDEGIFVDDFDGYWLSLPDGQNLATYIVEAGEDYIIYTSPIRLNGVDTNLRLRQDADGVKIEGAWEGINEQGAASRDLVKLEAGDVILPIYTAYGIETGEEFVYRGWEYTFDGEPEIYYDIMEDGDYMFAFGIDDIFGDYYLTDFVMFNVEDGEAYYYPDF